MPKSTGNALPSQNKTELEPPRNADVEEQLATLQHSHNRRYRLMGLETWAITETMDEFVPGFWSRFMANRQVAMKDFIERKYAKTSDDEKVEQQSFNGKS